MNQTENYIVLKPIAERFNHIASDITDGEIRSLIKSELREQLKCVDFGGMISEIAYDWVDNNRDVVEKKMKYAYETNWCPSCGSNLV